jgi:uncharacterized protein YkwD
MRRRRRRGTVPFAVLAAVLIVPVPAAIAGSSQLGTVIATSVDAGALASPVKAPVRAAAGACANARRTPARLAASAARTALLCVINRARTQHGLAAFAAEPHLRQAATAHARDMVRRGFFAHQRPGGPSLTDRLHAAGWHGHAVGEAIAWGCGKPAGAATTVRAWLHSPPHRAILLSGGFSRAGIGVAGKAPGSCRPGATWVLDTAS